MEEEFFNESNAAKALGISRRTLRLHRKAGKIIGLDMGGIVLYRNQALVKWRKDFGAQVRAKQLLLQECRAVVGSFG